MALIECPECGEKVSSSAKQCVHCGAKYSVCPECGKVYLGEQKVCSECGYHIIEEEKVVSVEFADKTVSPAIKANLKKGKLLEAWEASSSFARIFNKRTNKWINRILNIVGLITFCVAVIMLVCYEYKNTSSDFYAIFNGKYPYASTLSVINLMIVISCICTFISVIFEKLWSGCRIMLLSDFGTKNKVDFVAAIKHCNNVIAAESSMEGAEAKDIEKSSDDLKCVQYAAYLSANKDRKTYYIVYLCILAVLSLIAEICLGVCLSQNAEAYLYSKFMSVLYSNNTEYAYSFQYVALIFFITFGLAGDIYSIFGLKSEKKKVEAYSDFILNENN